MMVEEPNTALKTEIREQTNRNTPISAIPTAPKKFDNKDVVKNVVPAIIREVPNVWRTFLNITYHEL